MHKIFAGIMSLSLHSMQTERIVSHHNIVASDARVSMTDDTIISRLFIALNGIGTAYYDSRAAVANLLGAKERRNREPDFETYSRRQFVKKFFRKDGHF